MKIGNLVKFTYGSNTFVVIINSDSQPYDVTHVERGINKAGFYVPIHKGVISTSDFISEIIIESAEEMTRQELLDWRASGNGELPEGSVTY